MGSTDTYRRYVELFGLVRSVMASDPQRVSDVTWNIRCQYPHDDLAVCLAIFDAVADRPMLAPVHFVRWSEASQHPE
jgi:hypothetical protein